MVKQGKGCYYGGINVANLRLFVHIRITGI